MRLSQYECFVHWLGCFRAETGRKCSHGCSGLWHRPYSVQTGENYLNFRKCNSWNFCYYFLRCLFHFFSCLTLLKVIYLLYMACDVKNSVIYLFWSKMVSLAGAPCRYWYIMLMLHCTKCLLCLDVNGKFPDSARVLRVLHSLTTTPAYLIWESFLRGTSVFWWG